LFFHSEDVSPRMSAPLGFRPIDVTRALLREGAKLMAKKRRAAKKTAKKSTKKRAAKKKGAKKSPKKRSAKKRAAKKSPKKRSKKRSTKRQPAPAPTFAPTPMGF